MSEIRSKWILALARMTIIGVLVMLGLVALDSSFRWNDRNGWNDSGVAWGQTGTEQVWEIRDFSGGMVTDFDGADLERKYGSFVYNFDVTRASLRARQGLELKYNVQSQVDTLLGGFAYTVSEPDYDELQGVSQNGEIFIIHGIKLTTGNEIESFFMRPKYTSAGTGIGQGAWADSWSTDFNSATKPLGRTAILRSGGLRDLATAYGSLHMAAGAQKLGTTYSYPWWFGYVGRWKWKAYESLTDGFYLYEGSLFKPDTSILLNGVNGRVDSLKQVPITDPSGPDGVGIGTGRYWLALAYEYDGFQYSAPVIDSSLYVDVSTTDKILKVGVRIDTTLIMTSGGIGHRTTALIIFSSDSIETSGYWYTAPPEPGKRPRSRRGWAPQEWIDPDPYNDISQLPMFFRKRLVIADADTAELGYWWKRYAGGAQGYHYKWEASNPNGRVIYAYLDNDDFSPLAADMWDYLENSSRENVVLPEHYAIVGDFGLAGDVLIESPYSKVHERYRNMVIISPPGQPDNLPINNSIFVGAGAGSYVTGIREWNGKALIWTNDAFEVWEPGIPPARLEQFRQMGSTAPLSIQINPNGIFWGNADAIYQWTGAGIPQPITPLVKAAFDSLNQLDDTGYLHTDQFTGPYAASAYLPGSQKYIYILQDSVCGRADSLLQDSTFWSSVGWRQPPRITGGYESLVYDIQSQAWSRYHWAQPILSTFSGWDGTVYAVSLGSSPTYANTILRIPGRTDLSPNWMYDVSSLYNCRWVSNWTDFGDGSSEKEITGIAVDVALRSLWKADSLQLDVYADGRGSIYDTYKFASGDTLGDSKFWADQLSWRRTIFVAADSMGMTIEDPTSAFPVFYKFDLTAGPLMNNFDAPLEVYGLRIYYVTRNRRQ